MMIQERLRTKYEFLTKNEKKVADFVLEQGEEAVFLPISVLSRRVKISPSTIVRFSKAVGYKGYPELQKDLQNLIKAKLSPPKALQQSILKEHGNNPYSKIFETDIQNLNKTRKANTEETIDKAVEEIITARKIGCVGLRSSHGTAYLLYFFFGQVRKNCELLDFSSGSLPNQLINYGPRDLIVSICFSRYSALTLNILKYAKKNGCRVVSITDKLVSPIGQVSDLVLLAGTKSSTYFNSFTSTVTLINCLVAGLSLKSKRSVGVLKSVNQVAKDWNLLLM